MRENEEGKKEVFLAKDPAWAIKVLKQVLADVSDGEITSRSMNTSSAIKEYFEGFSGELAVDKGKSVESANISTVGINNTEADKPNSGKTGTQTKKRATPRVRKSLAPKKHEHNHPLPEKGKLLLKEAAQIDCNKFPISAAFVLRAFTELAGHTAADALKVSKGTKGKPKSLETLLKDVVDEAIKQGKLNSKDIRPFRTSFLNTGPTSIRSLNSFVHSRWSTPDAQALRNAWDKAVPFYQLAFGKP